MLSTSLLLRLQTLACHLGEKHNKIQIQIQTNACERVINRKIIIYIIRRSCAMLIIHRIECSEVGTVQREREVTVVDHYWFRKCGTRLNIEILKKNNSIISYYTSYNKYNILCTKYYGLRFNI